ncbi:MAG TPA: hypothetical protein VNA69_01830 [Thermoanaerobaculia bacterium]|nr:hypothetical protein [Thermoanaerobaculia bacterium]
MWPIVDVSELANEVAEEIGLDVSHVRPRDRLFFSGFELALWVAGTLLSSFFIGYLKGIRKAGEKLGERSVDALLERFEQMRSRFRNRDPIDQKALRKDVAALMEEMQEAVQEVPRLQAATAFAEEEQETTRTLLELNFPADQALLIAERTLVTIRRRWRG